MNTFSGHYTVLKGHSPFSGQHQEIPDDPEKFWTVDDPTPCKNSLKLTSSSAWKRTYNLPL